MSAKTITRQLAEVEIELAQANDANSKASATIAAHEATIADLTARNAALAQDFANVQEQAKLDAATIAKLTDEIGKLNASAKSAEQIAGERLANISTPPVEEISNAPVTKAELWTQYHALTSPTARRDFWLAHKKEMSA